MTDDVCCPGARPLLRNTECCAMAVQDCSRSSGHRHHVSYSSQALTNAIPAAQPWPATNLHTIHYTAPGERTRACRQQAVVAEANTNPADARAAAHPRAATSHYSSSSHNNKTVSAQRAGGGGRPPDPSGACEMPPRQGPKLTSSTRTQAISDCWVAPHPHTASHETIHRSSPKPTQATTDRITGYWTQLHHVLHGVAVQLLMLPSTTVTRLAHTACA